MESPFDAADAVADSGYQTLPSADPVSSVLPDKNEKSEAVEKETKTEECDSIRKWKSAILVSGIVVAVAGAIFAITKKLREK